MLNWFRKQTSSTYPDYPQDLSKSERNPNECQWNSGHPHFHNQDFIHSCVHSHKNKICVGWPYLPIQQQKLETTRAHRFQPQKNLNWTFPGEPTTELGTENTIPHPIFFLHVYNSKICCMFWENSVQWFGVAKTLKTVRKLQSSTIWFFCQSRQSWLTRFHKSSCLPSRDCGIWSNKS